MDFAIEERVGWRLEGQLKSVITKTKMISVVMDCSCKSKMVRRLNRGIRMLSIVGIWRAISIKPPLVGLLGG